MTLGRDSGGAGRVREPLVRAFAPPRPETPMPAHRPASYARLLPSSRTVTYAPAVGTSETLTGPEEESLKVLIRGFVGRNKAAQAVAGEVSRA